MGANIEIFGCNVAAPGSDGQNLLNALASVTHAAVFASTDSTGAGGNWQLEAASAGANPAALPASAVPLNTPLLASYAGTLGTIAVDTISSAATASGGAASLTFSHTVNSGSDSILIVEVTSSHGGAGDPVTSVTYGGQNLTLLGSANLPNAESADIWYLLAPPVGTASVVVTLTGSCHFVAGATDYFGVDQATPLGTLVTATGNSSTPSLTVASAAGQLVIDSLIAQGDVAPIAPSGPGQTQLWSQTTGTSAGDALGGGSDQAGASSVTMSWTQSSAKNWALAAVPLISAAPVTTLTVNTAADTLAGDTSSVSALIANPGPGGLISLRDAITAADNTASATPITIDFDIPGSGTQTINLLSALPAITNSVIIDATSQPGYAGTPLVQLQGTANPYNGLDISANHVTIEGLSIYGFSAGNGIQITSASGTVIQADYVGLAADNSVGANGTGIVLSDATNSIIGGTTAAQRNIISGNTYGGMRLESGSSGNVIEGNYIGVDVTGTATRANSLDGILITGAPNNTIGGVAAGAGNVISGNTGPGVDITGAASTGNVVAGNYIGTNAAGTAALGNSSDGIEISANNNLVGGTAAADRNLISGNLSDGIFITSGNNNQIEGNYIGTDVTGTAALANADEGVEIAGGTGNIIGGAVAGAGNVISGNGQLGVWLYGNSSLNTSSNFVEGNLIGTDATGMAALGNGYGGIEISDSSANTIGGTTAAAGNVISGNSDCGVTLQSSSNNNLIEGNFIGTAADGVTALGNAAGGVWIDSSSNNTIGGTTPGAGNIIANTTAGNGVTVVGSSTAGRHRRQFDLWRQRPGHRPEQRRRHAQRFCQPPARGRITCKTIPSFPTPSPTARA